MKREIVPTGKVIWQSDTAKTYQCPHCLRPIFSQYEGEELPEVTCYGPMEPHTLEWADVE